MTKHITNSKKRKKYVICLDEVETEWRELECQHRYHTQCIENWIAVSAKCPLCMKYIKDNKLKEINHTTLAGFG